MNCEAAVLSLNTAELSPYIRPMVIAPGYTWDAEHSLYGLVDDLRARGVEQVVIADYYGEHPPRHDEILAAELNQAGFDLHDATNQLAFQFLATIKREGLQDTAVDVVAHSYGTLIYFHAFQMADTLDWRCLVPDENSQGDMRNAVFLAPSGSLEHETLPGIMERYIVNTGSLAVQSRLDEAFIDQQKMFFGHIPTRLREAWCLAHQRIDYELLATAGVRVPILEYSSDKMFPPIRYNENAGMNAAAIRSSILDPRATHSDPLLHPAQNARAILDLLYPTQFIARTKQRWAEFINPAA